MNNDKLPIKRFEKREIDILNTEGGGDKHEAKWFLSGHELVDRASRLSERLENIPTYFFENVVEFSTPLLITAQINQNGLTKTHRKEISTFFSDKPQKTNIIGFDKTGNLIVEIESKAVLDSVKSKTTDFEKNKHAISCIEDLNVFEPDFVFEGENNYKVKLIDFQDFEKNNAAQNEFEKILHELSIEYTKVDYSQKLVVYKLMEVTDDTLPLLKNANKNFKKIYSIEVMPKYCVSLDTADEETNLEIKLPDDASKYETIGILDSGISDNKYLKPWLEGDIQFYPSEYIDKNHGTFVAGVAVYGDELEGRTFVGGNGVKLFDAAIFPNSDKESLDEDDLIQIFENENVLITYLRGMFSKTTKKTVN